MSTENFYATTGAGASGGGAGTAEKFDYDVISSKRSAINGFLKHCLSFGSSSEITLSTPGF